LVLAAPIRPKVCSTAVSSDIGRSKSSSARRVRSATGDNVGATPPDCISVRCRSNSCATIRNVRSRSFGDGQMAGACSLISTRSAFSWFESYQVTPAMMRSLSSCFEVARMWRRTERANSEKKPFDEVEPGAVLGRARPAQWQAGSLSMAHAGPSQRAEQCRPDARNHRPVRGKAQGESRHRDHRVLRMGGRRTLPDLEDIAEEQLAPASGRRSHNGNLSTWTLLS